MTIEIINNYTFPKKKKQEITEDISMPEMEPEMEKE